MKLHRDLEVEVYRCLRCGFCRAQCGVYKEKRSESWNTRGRMMLVKSLMEDQIEPSRSVLDRLYACTLCKACEVSCPSLVKIHDVLRNVREEFYESGLMPEALINISNSVKREKNIYELPNEDRTFWLNDLETKGNFKVDRKAEVAYFVGCVSSFMGRLEEIPKSMIKILSRANLDFTVLGSDEWCCGSPLILSGASKEAEELVKHNTETLRRLGVKTLVTTCAGCYRTFKMEYPDILKEDMGIEVLHASELIARLIDNGLKLKRFVGERVTYHDPCELGRHLGVYEEPRKVLEGISGLKLLELTRNRENCTCCGGGGMMKATAPDLALRMASTKLREVSELGVKKLITGCAACKLNLMDAATKEESDTEILDIVEVVARSL